MLNKVIITKTSKDIKDVLISPSKTIKEIYFVITGKGYNITVLMSGLLGQEYYKTHGHFHKSMSAEIYQCLFGQGILLMQRNDEQGEAKEFKVVTLVVGKTVVVPSGFGHAVVNTGKNFLVVLDNSSSDPIDHDYKTVEEKSGFAYYIVEKRGEIVFEPNPTYRVHAQITTE